MLLVALLLLLLWLCCVSGVFFKHGERFRDLVGSPYYVAPEVRARHKRDCIDADPQSRVL